MHLLYTIYSIVSKHGNHCWWRGDTEAWPLLFVPQHPFPDYRRLGTLGNTTHPSSVKLCDVDWQREVWTTACNSLTSLDTTSQITSPTVDTVSFELDIVLMVARLIHCSNQMNESIRVWRRRMERYDDCWFIQNDKYCGPSLSLCDGISLNRIFRPLFLGGLGSGNVISAHRCIAPAHWCITFCHFFRATDMLFFSRTMRVLTLQGCPITTSGLSTGPPLAPTSIQLNMFGIWCKWFTNYL